MAEEGQEQLPPIYSARDAEIIVWNRVLHRLAKLGKEDIVVTDEDYSRMWDEEVRGIMAQIQKRDKRKRGQLRRWMGITGLGE